MKQFKISGIQFFFSNFNFSRSFCRHSCQSNSWIIWWEILRLLPRIRLRQNPASAWRNNQGFPPKPWCPPRPSSHHLPRYASAIFPMFRERRRWRDYSSLLFRSSWAGIYRHWHCKSGGTPSTQFRGKRNFGHSFCFIIRREVKTRV